MTLFNKHSKRTPLILFFLCVVHITWAQTHDFSLGVHAGMSSYLTDGNIKNIPSATGGIDIAYTVRGVIANQTALGIRLGASLSYAGATQSLPNYKEQYINVDYYSEQIDYTITATTYKEQQHQFQVEAPLFLSFITHGITINIGGKFMMPFYQKRHIDVTEAHIAAYYPDFWVSVTDYQATGRLENNEHHSKEPSKMPQLNALLAAEIGYEWRVGQTNRMGVLLYLDYGLWNNYSNNPPRQRLVDVDPILNTEYPVPDIRVKSLTDTYSTKVNYFSCGIKWYYAFHGESPKVHRCHCLYD